MIGSVSLLGPTGVCSTSQLQYDPVRDDNNLEKSRGRAETAHCEARQKCTSEPPDAPRIGVEITTDIEQTQPQERTISHNVCIASSRVYLPGYESQPSVLVMNPSHQKTII